MNRLKIAVVTPGTFAVPSGTTSSVETAAMETAARLKLDADVAVIGRKGIGQRSGEVIDGVRFARTSAKPYIRQAARIVRRLKPSVIHVENRPRFARSLKRLFPSTPVVLSLHSTTFMSRPHIGPKTLRTCLSRADAIVVNSFYLKKAVEQVHPPLAGKTAVNHLGVDVDRFVSRWSDEERAKREEQLERLGLAGKKIILYVGRFIPIKGVHHLVKAMYAVSALQPDAVLLLVGGAYYGSNRVTPYVRRLQRLAGYAKEHIRFIPFVPHEHIHEWFRLADVVVVPSSAREAFGLVNVEAMASGVPVVAAASGGMKEIIEHGRSGLLVDPERIAVELVEHICAVLDNPDYGRALGENGIARVRDSFTWDRTAERLLQLYGELLREKE